MVKIFFIFILLTQSLYAQIISQVTKTNLSDIEELQLVITASDINSQIPPNFSQLEKDFNILGQSQSKSISIINGHRSSQVAWKLLLEPKRTGKLRIPVFSLQGQHSKAIDIQVSSAKQTNFSKQPFFLTTEVSQLDPYVQEQVIYTINLYTQHRADINLNIPVKIENALIVPLNTKQALKKTTYKGKTVWVKSFQYAIYPQVVGEVIIPRIKQTVQVIGDGRRQSLLLFAQTIKLSVKDIDEKYPVNQYWLPAQSALLKAQFITNPPIFKVGDVIEREIELTVVGQSKNQLPNITLGTDQAFEQYLDSKTLSHQVKNGKVVSILKQKVIIIANQAGEQILPEIKLYWFDTQTQSTKIAILPAQSIEVLAGNINKNQIKNQPITPKISQSVEAKLPKEITIKPSHTVVVKELPSYYWYLLYGLLALWLLTILFCFLRTKSNSTYKGTIVKQKNDSNLLKNIKKLCGKNQAKPIKNALNQWAVFHGFINIDEWAKNQNVIALLLELNKLDQAIHQQTPWQGQSLYQIFEQLIKQKSGKNIAIDLYPQPLRKSNKATESDVKIFEENK